MSDQTALVQAARDSLKKAYAPYSQYRVGAAVLDDQGRTFTGCNIENASYGATVCAERTAIFKAVSEGAKEIRLLAVVTEDGDYARPCGICRQVMAEFAAADFRLLAANRQGDYIEKTLAQLLPDAFGPGALRAIEG